MPCTRHIIVCEGESEHAYLQRLQSFLDSQPLPPDTFEAPLRFIGPMHAVAKTGSFGKIKSAYNRTRTDNRKTELKRLRMMQPCDMNQDIYKQGYEFTN